MSGINKQVQKIIDKFIKASRENEFGKIGYKKAREFLLRHIEEGSRCYYSKERLMFSKIKNHPAVPALINLINTNIKNKEKIDHAVKALELLGDQHAIPTLIDLAENNHSGYALTSLARVAIKGATEEVLNFIERNKDSMLINHFLINIANMARRIEIDESMARRWEELKKQDPKPFIMDVHDYVETVSGELKIDTVIREEKKIKLPFSTKFTGETEFGHMMIYDVQGEIIFVKDIPGLQVNWTKREEISCEHWGTKGTSEALLDIDDLGEDF